MEGTTGSSTFVPRNTLIQRPPNVGTRDDIPDDILRVAQIQQPNNIIAWVTLDDKFRQNRVWKGICYFTLGIVFLPCLPPSSLIWWPCQLLSWPFLLLLWPFLLPGILVFHRVIHNTYWVLTSIDVKVIVKRQSGYCGCGPIGGTVKSIPLDSITDCGISNPDTGHMPFIYVDTASGSNSSHAGHVPTMHVDTANSSSSSAGSHPAVVARKHETVGYGLTVYDWLAAEINARRDAEKGHNNNHHLLSSPSPVPLITMERDEKSNGGEAAEGRLLTIKNLLNAGLLTEVEYEKKRQEIISSI
jgi:hypothetical protein